MEAALKDFEEWAATLISTKIEYYAIFDPGSGKVTGIYPDHAAKDIQHKILINDAIAESVFEGKTTLNSYVVDLTSANVEFIETETLIKIDDVLHKVIDSRQQLSQIDNDIFLIYDRTGSSITIELSKIYNGTRNSGGVLLPKNVHWSGETELLFFLTEYNDPNYLIYSIPVRLNELIKQKKIVDNIVLPEKFSVYTRRLFKNYIVEEI
jgi:hypothetical protein